MTRRRIVTVLAAAAIAASVAPATAHAAPVLPGGIASLADLFPTANLNPDGDVNPADKSKGCNLDWNAVASIDLASTEPGQTQPDADSLFVQGDKIGATQVHVWNNNGTPWWRVVVGAGADIDHYKLVMKMPAGYTYKHTVGGDTWFFAGGYNVKTADPATFPWPNALGADALDVVEDGATATVTVKSGKLKAKDRFYIEWQGVKTDSNATKLTATAQSTGNAASCGGNGSIGSIFG